MNYAVLVDLNSMRLSYDSFAKALSTIDGKVAYAKLYGYNNKRNNDFNNFIKTYGAEVALPVNNRKKVRIDIRQVIDAITIACTHKSVDAFFIICSELDSIAMINALKKLGKESLWEFNRLVLSQSNAMIPYCWREWSLTAKITTFCL